VVGVGEAEGYGSEDEEVEGGGGVRLQRGEGGAARDQGQDTGGEWRRISPLLSPYLLLDGKSSDTFYISLDGNNSVTFYVVFIPCKP
jgi:hypothetical protein